MMIAIDMDGVICSEERMFSRSLAKIMPGAKDSIDQLRAEGHKVIIYSARTWAEIEMTQKWLKDNHIEYDGLCLGKIAVDCFVDDRAISFRDWKKTSLDIKEFAKRKRHPDVVADEDKLEFIRKDADLFINEIASNKELCGPILDVSSSHAEGAVYKKYIQHYINARKLFNSKGLGYKTLDTVKSNNVDYVGSLLDVENILPKHEFGAVILNHVLEHMTHIFEVPLALNYLLMKNGIAYITTPWNFKFQGHKQDCWRISEDGYHALFDNTNFEILKIEKRNFENEDKTYPATIRCLVKKIK